MRDFTEIKRLRNEINLLIKEKPELRVLQDEIDKRMLKCGNNVQRRNAVIQDMLLKKWHEVLNPMTELVNILQVGE